MRRHGEGECSKNLHSDEISALDDPLKIVIITKIQETSRELQIYVRNYKSDSKIEDSASKSQILHQIEFDYKYTLILLVILYTSKSLPRD